MKEADYSRDFWVSLLNLIESLPADKPDYIPYDTLLSLSGDHWMDIMEYLIAEETGERVGGGFKPYDYRYIEALKPRCHAFIEKIDKAEEDRAISNDEKIRGIDIAQKSLCVSEKSQKYSRISLSVTIVVAIGQLIQWTIMLIQWLNSIYK